VNIQLAMFPRLSKPNVCATPRVIKIKQDSIVDLAEGETIEQRTYLGREKI
jgi:hypothetical protein